MNGTRDLWTRFSAAIDRWQPRLMLLLLAFSAYQLYGINNGLEVWISGGSVDVNGEVSINGPVITY